MKKITVFLIILIIFIIVGFLIVIHELFSNRRELKKIQNEVYNTKPLPSKSKVNEITQNSNLKHLFMANLDEDKIISETGKSEASGSNDWWLNSGGLLSIGDGAGQTIQGNLNTNDKWYELYKKSNSQDTDGGVHPQNLFRLVTKDSWQNLDQRAYFLVTADNLSDSPNRNSSNGIFLFNRYKDGDNLYYVGLRVDGNAVIKKKQNGVYTTLGEFQYFPGKYETKKNPNVIPKNSWIGIRSTLRNVGEKVLITQYIDTSGKGNWTKALEIIDDKPGQLKENGRAGIRTDFMDVKFKNYQINETD